MNINEIRMKYNFRLLIKESSMKTIKKITLIFTFCLLSFTFYLSSNTWVKTYRPFQEPYMQDKYWVEDVIITQDSGYVVSGSFELYDDFFYENWGFLMKTDRYGNILWASKDSVDFMSYNGYSVEFVETSDGGFLTIGFQGFAGDRYIMKRDSEGNYLWALPYGNNFGVFSMHNTHDGNVILAGRSDYNAALRKITEDGTTLWTKIIDVGTSIAYSVYECTNGDYVLTGVDYDNYNILVIRTDSLGDSLWTRTFEGLGGHDIGNCIIETDAGNIFAGGWIINNGHNGFLWNLDSSGNTIWTHIYDDGSMYYILSLLENNDNHFIILGSKLMKINNIPEVIWNEPLTGDDFGQGDKNLQETSDGGFLCVATEDYGDRIVLNKTDSLGQVYSIDEPGTINPISITIFPNPLREDCNISLNSKVSSKDPVVSIYNIKGQLIRELECSASDLEFHAVWDGKSFDGEEVQNGIYFLKLESDNYSTVKKVTKIK